MHPLIPYFETIIFTLPTPWGEPLVLSGFMLAMVTGFIVGIMASSWRAKRVGLDNHQLERFYPLLVIGIIVGGHIGHGVFYQPELFFAQPALFLDFRSGYSSISGFAAVAILLAIFLYKTRMPVLKTVDSLVFGMCLTWFFTRIGCTFNHEHPGTPSQFFLARFCRPVEGYTWELPSWLAYRPDDLRFAQCKNAVESKVSDYTQTVPLDYPGVISVHDLGFYEVLLALFLFFVLALFELTKRRLVDGSYIVLFVVVYAPARIGFDMLRPEFENPRYGIFTAAQWGCAALLVLVLLALVYQRLSKTKI